MDGPRPEILFVSKPLSPPWDDSGKLLPFLVARHLEMVRPIVLVPRGHTLVWPGGACEEVYGRVSSFRVPRLDKVRLLWRLLASPTPHLVHFFFSPNPATTAMGRLFRRMKPDALVLQTIMSLPRESLERAGGVFGDVIVVWSALAASLVQEHLERHGLPGRVVHIPPGIEPLSPMEREEKRSMRVSLGLPPDVPLFLFAGDLEFSIAATTLAHAVLKVLERTSAVFVFACRTKTPAALRVSRDVQAVLAGPIARGQVRFLTTVQVFHDLVRCVDVQVLPADTTYAKTDLPMVVLEGLSAGVPAVVGTGTAMDELVVSGAAIGVDPRSPEALAEVLVALAGDPEARAAAGRAGRDVVMKRYTASAMAKAYDRLYLEVSGG